MKETPDLRYRFIFSFILLTGDTCGYIQYCAIKATTMDPYGSVVDYRTLLAISVICIVPLTIFYKRHINILFLLIRLVILLLILTLVNDNLTITIILSTAFLFSAGFYLRLPYNLIMVAIAGVSILLFQRSIWIDGQPTPTIRPGEQMMLGFLFVMILIMDYVISYIIQSQESLKTLLADQKATIIKLIETNVGIQKFALNKKEEYEDAERMRITRDIHDTIGYVMTNNIMLLRACKYYVPERLKKVHSFLDDALENAQKGLNETRSILKLLHDMNDRGNGAAEIIQIIKLFQEATGIKVAYSFGNTMGTWGKNLDYVFYRVIQEGLVNSVKHGNATEISVGFWQTDADVLLTIADNGKGSKESQTMIGIGLRGMQERLAAFGGTVDSHSYSHGFSLHVAVPIFSAHKDEDHENH